MGNLYNTITELCKQKGITGGKMCSDLGISKGTLTDLKMGRQKSLSAVKAQQIAGYFGVTVGYLLGNEEAPTVSGERQVCDEDIKFALFGGSGEITDAMYREVKEFAALVKLREDMKKSKE